MVGSAVLAVVAGHICDGAAGVNNQPKTLRGTAQPQAGVKVALTDTVCVNSWNCVSLVDCVVVGVVGRQAGAGTGRDAGMACVSRGGAGGGGVRVFVQRCGAWTAAAWGHERLLVR